MVVWERREVVKRTATEGLDATAACAEHIRKQKRCF